MNKPAEVELAQLKEALTYLIGLLQEGSLVERYHEETREEIADVLWHLLSKVEGLPEGVPKRLVQAAAVRALIEAAETRSEGAKEEKQAALARHMREAEASASVRGHSLGEWEPVPGSDMEYQATCADCGGFVYVSYSSTYDLLLDDCERV